MPALACHPAALDAAFDTAPAPFHVQASAWRAGAAGLHLRYAVHCPPQALRCPPPAAHCAAAPQDGLWQRTCLEAFVCARESGDPGESGEPGDPDEFDYREFNFSPDGRWAGYAFCAPRQRDAGWREWERRAAPAQWRCAWQADSPDGALPGRVLTLHAFIADVGLPAQAVWQVGLCAVLQAADERLSYWALRHPRPVPDFHDRRGWPLALPPAVPF